MTTRRQMSHQFLSALHERSSLSALPISPHGKFALDSIITDAWAKNRGVERTKVEQALASDVADTSFIDKLWYAPENKVAVDAFMNNKLCRDAAKGEATALEAYKTYAVQDYFYLIEYVKFKALRLTSVPSQDLKTLQDETASVGRSYDYASGWKTTCEEKIHVPSERFNDELSIALLAYANFLQNQTRTEDWFSLHVILIACNFGWCRLALELYNETTTDRTTSFYETWIAANLDIKKNPDGTETAELPSWAIDIANFLAVNDKEWTSDEDRKTYQSLFRTSLRLEVALFNSGYEDHSPPEMQ